MLGLATSSCAIARPMPLLAPVTRAIVLAAAAMLSELVGDRPRATHSRSLTMAQQVAAAALGTMGASMSTGMSEMRRHCVFRMIW